MPRAGALSTVHGEQSEGEGAFPLHSPAGACLLPSADPASPRGAEGVVHRSEAINSKLEARQRTIEELNAVRQLLRKLQGVFDLPKRLRAMLDAGALDLGAESYAEVGPFLRRHGHKVRSSRVAWRCWCHRCCCCCCCC